MLLTVKKGELCGGLIRCILNLLQSACVVQFSALHMCKYVCMCVLYTYVFILSTVRIDHNHIIH